jgi:hypothetical protein
VNEKLAASTFIVAGVLASIHATHPFDYVLPVLLLICGVANWVYILRDD